jgi:hypothetical protein
MTGWGRGRCNPYGGRGGGQAFGPSFGWSGRGRGRRHRFWATGMPRWGRGGFPGSYYEPSHSYRGPSFSGGDEIAGLQERAAWLKEELEAIEQRLGELETRRGDQG